MPIRLEAETLHHALAQLDESDHEAAVDARASLSWLGWDAEGPLLLRRYDLQLHIWYELPTKVPRRWRTSTRGRSRSGGCSS